MPSLAPESRTAKSRIMNIFATCRHDQEVHAARTWLLEAAFPLWAERGFQRQTGGFYDNLDPQARPLGEPTRLRVQTRQIYAFAQAGRLGWAGPWREMLAACHGFLSKYFLRADGFYRSRVTDGDLQTIDLYDQAFVLLGLAQLHRMNGGGANYLDRAHALLERLDAVCRDAQGGYVVPPAGEEKQANPNMHLLEAFLAWGQVAGDAYFLERAATLIRLACGRLFQTDAAAIPERYDAQWHPVHGARAEVEPGHQFEWAFLLYWANLLTGADTSATANALVKTGLDLSSPERPGVTAFQADPVAGVIVDRRARLWAQTERLRTLWLCSASPGFWTVPVARELAQSWRVVGGFLDTEIPGLWHEWQDEDGRFVRGPVPATSLYHVVSALLTVQPRDMAVSLPY